MLDEIVAQARAEAPDECCGLVGTRDGEAVRLLKLRNAAASPLRYEIDPKDQLRAFDELDDAGLDLGIIYHQQDSSGRALEIAWAESPPGSVRAGDPEAGLAADRKLRHNLVAVADEVYHSGPECVTVELHGVTSPIDPELGLYTGHVQNLTSAIRARSTRALSTSGVAKPAPAISSTPTTCSPPSSPGMSAESCSMPRASSSTSDDGHDCSPAGHAMQ